MSAPVAMETTPNATKSDEQFFVLALFRLQPRKTRSTAALTATDDVPAVECRTGAMIGKLVTRSLRKHFIGMKELCCAKAIIVTLSMSLTACASISSENGRRQTPFSDSDFERLLQTVADGWNANDAAMASSAFAIDAVYSEPPDRQTYRGRQELFEFFGGADGRDSEMSMTWHHISFNEDTSTGAGEFTFAWPTGQVHGMVSIRVEDGLIANWREYYYASDLVWDRFIRLNPF